jgi:2-polyprenyl-3-methyl-5-hydroxy-6-metoxy-1,4-benzoquinol methylase
LADLRALTYAERFMQSPEAPCLDAFAGAVADFFDLPEADVRKRLQAEYENPGAAVAEAWRDAAPETPQDVTRFYEETTSYVFDLAADNCRDRRRPLWTAILDRLALAPGKDVLAFGDGIGTDSIALTRAGYRVTYFDVPGVTSRFARFCFEREGLADRIALINRAEDLPEEGFDAILSIEVLEHLPDPVGTMERFFRLVRENGVVLLTESFESVGPDYPSHLEGNYRYAGRTHRIMESIGFANTYFNGNPINRPMEFRKVPPGRSGDVIRTWGRVKRTSRTRWRYFADAAVKHRPR